MIPPRFVRPETIDNPREAAGDCVVPEHLAAHFASMSLELSLLNARIAESLRKLRKPMWPRDEE